MTACVTGALACAALLLVSATPAVAAPPRAASLSEGWEVRDVAGDRAEAQPAPPEESAEGEDPGAPVVPPTQDPSQSFRWRGTNVPSVFDARVKPALYPGEVRHYRLRFRGPRTPPGFSWLIQFGEVRRAAGVYLNGRRIGGNRDAYTPFALPARGLRPGRENELVVKVDSRKDPRLLEGWWNWGGIVRPVRLIPVGRAYVRDLGTMSRVKCKGPARGCRAELLLDGVLERRRARLIEPRLHVRLRAPGGRVIRRTVAFAAQRATRRRIRAAVAVPAPRLWSPNRPRLYSARFELRDRGQVQQVVRRRIGLRSMAVKRGLLYLNNRRVALRGASIHEDMPGSGAALTATDMDRIVDDLRELGANVTRAHYLLDERLLSRLDRAGIMVWSQAPIWQRDHGANLLRRASGRERALLTVRRTVTAARNHPSVITHSVANELTFTPDALPTTRRFLLDAAAQARKLDRTLPISVDIKGRPGIPEQFTYSTFDMLGINQYFGWYSWVRDFEALEPWLLEMRDIYPTKALVMTEFGAEARPELATAPPETKGGYAFQSNHVARTMDVVDRSPWISGAIYWTLREFEIHPGWRGGAGRRPPEYEPNTRHQKGLLTYEGEKKPAWYVMRDRIARTPLYTAGRR